MKFNSKSSELKLSSKSDNVDNKIWKQNLEALGSKNIKIFSTFLFHHPRQNIHRTDQAAIMFGSWVDCHIQPCPLLLEKHGHTSMVLAWHRKLTIQSNLQTFS